NACPVVRVNINEYDLLSHPESVDVVLKKIGHVIHTYRQVDQRS
ncbi:deoxynucleoside kinase, partial [Staphylococcus pseudintermedius]